MSNLDQTADIETFLQSTKARFAGYIERHASSPVDGIPTTPDEILTSEWVIHGSEDTFPVNYIRIGLSHDPAGRETQDDGLVYGLEFFWEDEKAFSLLLSDELIVTDGKTISEVAGDLRVGSLLDQLEKFESDGSMYRIL